MRWTNRAARRGRAPWFAPVTWLLVATVTGSLPATQSVAEAAPAVQAAPRAWPVIGSEFEIGLGSGTNASPGAAWHPGGPYLVTWEFAAMAPNWGNVHGQRLTAAGALSGARIDIAATQHNETQPKVAYNSQAGHFLVIWLDPRTPGQRAVYGRRVSPDGSLLGADFQISGPDAEIADYTRLGIAYNSVANQYLAVWTDLREGDRAVYGRRIRANGSTIGNDFRINGPGATAESTTPAVAYSPAANQYLVAWQDERNQADRGWDIYARRVRANGVPAPSDFRISNNGATADEYSPAVAYDSTDDEFLVVWQDGRSGVFGIYGQRLEAGGPKIGSNFRISRAPEDESGPAVAFSDTAHQYLVVWEDERNSADRGRDIFGRRVAADGTPLARDFRVCGTAGTGADRFPGITYGDDEYLVAWGAFRDSAWRTLGIRLSGLPSA
jgi:hypothetical protein